MDVLLFMLLIMSFSCGVIIIFLLFSRAKESGDPGTALFLAPLVPLTMITILETVNYYLRTRFPSRPLLLIEMIDDILLIFVAFGWNYLTSRHYDLNKLSVFYKNKEISAIYYSFSAYIFCACSLYINYQLKNILHLITITWLFFAGARAVNFHIKAANPLSSSKAAVKIAYISLIIYPVIFYRKYF